MIQRQRGRDDPCDGSGVRLGQRFRRPCGQCFRRPCGALRSVACGPARAAGARRGRRYREAPAPDRHRPSLRSWQAATAPKRRRGGRAAAGSWRGRRRTRWWEGLPLLREKRAYPPPGSSSPGNGVRGRSPGPGEVPRRHPSPGPLLASPALILPVQPAGAHCRIPAESRPTRMPVCHEERIAGPTGPEARA